MVRALVLGATGHIGAHIVRALLAGGHQVRAAFRRERFVSVLDALPVERVRVDLETLEGLDGALAGCAWVFHAAAYYPNFRDRRASALARGLASTRRVLERIRAAEPQRIVFTSSAATIRKVPGRDSTEQDAESWPLDGPRSLYATVKIAIEHEVLRASAAGLPVVVVNPSICIGEYDAHAFSGRLVLAFAKFRLPFYVDHELNAIYTGDVGVGHVRAAAQGRLGERYLLAERNISLKEFAVLVARAAGVAPPRWRLPYTRQPQRLDASKAIRELSLPQTPIEEAIRRALDWFRENQLL